MKNKTIRLDACFAAIGILVLSPLFISIIMAIIMETGEDPIYIDRRPGRRRWFPCYKFRTMRAAIKELPSDLTIAEIRKLEEEERVTRIGKFLRKTGLDELPQLWNIVRGHMNVVGPRPHPDHHWKGKPVTSWEKNILPGLTGWDQTSIRKETSEYCIEVAIENDLKYLELRDGKPWIERVIIDLKIIYATLPKLLGRKPNVEKLFEEKLPKQKQKQKKIQVQTVAA